MMQHMDERQERTAGNAALAVLGILMIAVVAYMAWDYFTRDHVSGLAVALVLGIGVLFWLFNRDGFGANPPRRWGGQGAELPTELAARPVRVRSYAWDATIAALGLTGMTAVGLIAGKEQVNLESFAGWTGLSGAPLIAVMLLAEFVGIWLVSYAISYIGGETASARIERSYRDAE